MKRFRYFISASFLSLVLGLLGIYYTLRGSRTHFSMDTPGALLAAGFGDTAAGALRDLADHMDAEKYPLSGIDFER